MIHSFENSIFVHFSSLLTADMRESMKFVLPTFFILLQSNKIT